ncbi:MAG TPA: SprT-like domain-containing protein [Flavobacteriaceae bacterium]|nr:SprT-like domain-containing protein [Flavobacteriaceae bacterium]
MKDILAQYIPPATVDATFELIKQHRVYLQIVNTRVTRHGDYRRLSNGQHKITVNASPNHYRFFITLIHEIAHLIAFETYGKNIKPHGQEWKMTFQKLMLPFLNPAVFPEGLLPLLAKHFKNPKASSDTDAHLALALKQFDLPNDKNFIFELPQGAFFRIYNGKVFKKGNKRIKRYECLEVKSGKLYLFNPNAEVELVETKQTQ